jgi:hypothetical protein
MANVPGQAGAWVRESAVGNRLSALKPEGRGLPIGVAETGSRGPGRRRRRRSLAQARHWAADVLANCGLSHLSDTACLLISELATKSLRHAWSPCELTIEVDDLEVLVEVIDHSSGMPVKAGPTRSDFGGKGLLFLDSLATSWGPV